MPETLESAPSTQSAAPSAPSQSTPAPASAAPAKTSQAPSKAAPGAQGASKSPASSSTSPQPDSKPTKAPVAPTDRSKAAASTGGQPAQSAPAGDSGQPAAPEFDFKSGYETLHRSNSELGRRMAAREAEIAQFKQQMDGYNRREAEARKSAEASKIKPFMAPHPDFKNTQVRIAKADSFDAALRSAPKELQADPAYRSALAKELGVKNEDLVLRDEAKAHQEQYAREIATNPDAFDKRAEEVAERKYKELRSREKMEEQIEQEVRQQFDDPVVRQFAAEHNEEVMKAINDGVPPQYAAHQIKLFSALTQAEARIAELESKLTEQSADVGMANEQQRLLKSRATHTREPAAAKVADPYKAWEGWLAENKVDNRLANHAQAKLQQYIAASMRPKP